MTAYSEYIGIYANTIDPTRIIGNMADNSATATDNNITKVKAYQDELKTTVANRKSINNDINAQLNYTMMAMTIWVPLGIFAGYYLYSRRSA